MNFQKFYSFNFLAKLLLSAIFVNAIPGKITNFGSQAQYISSRGFPEPLSNLLLIAAIALLISGSILLIFSNKTKLACSLLLIFLVPTTIIFHLVPFQLMAITRNLSLIGGLLIAIEKTNVNSFYQNEKKEPKEIEYSDLNEDN
ncbi:DoxX family protein [uncultured Prochlorococcus sp.]|uniref:DoxX family protein n=1 Tax=uncultured Prochlorococcus sp. TaxID=159733 RepID=UPI0025904715|nr:DoxX family membrane protein [uncultured Prochlorococcus sp.]